VENDQLVLLLSIDIPNAGSAFQGREPRISSGEWYCDLEREDSAYSATAILVLILEQ